MDYIFKKMLEIADDMGGNITYVSYNGTDYCSFKIAMGDSVVDITTMKKEEVTTDEH